MQMWDYALLDLCGLNLSLNRLATSRAKTIVREQLTTAVRTKIDGPDLRQHWGHIRALCLLGLRLVLHKRQQGV